MVPAIEDAVDLQVVRRQDNPSMNMKMVIGKACPSAREYHPRTGIAPLYEFCKLQTLLLAEADGRLLRDLEFRAPEGPMAKKLLYRFREILGASPKIGERKPGEFRKDGCARSYIIHALVSSDGTELCLRAKLVYVCHGASLGSRRGSLPMGQEKLRGHLPGRPWAPPQLAG